MYGFQAISASNGWAISVVGVTIVFTGLVLLAISIGQLHKILAIWDNRGNLRKMFSTEKETDAARPEPIVLTPDQKESARQFQLLVRTLDDSFALPKLLKLAEVSGLKHPHSALGILVKSNIIMPDRKGFYLWNRDRFNELAS